MTSFKGFIYSKLHGMGTKMEGPSYYLQAYSPSGPDYLLEYKKVNPWDDDKELHKFLAKKVKIEGDLEKRDPPVIKVEKIEKIDLWKE